MKAKIFLCLAAASLTAGAVLAQVQVVPPSDVAAGITSQAVETGGEARRFDQLGDWESWLKNSLASFARDSLEQGAAEAESCVSRAQALDIFLPAYARILHQLAGEVSGRQGRQVLVGTLSRLALEADPTRLSNIIAARRLSRLGRGYSLGMALQDISVALSYFNPRLRAFSHLLLWISILGMAWAALFWLFLWVRHLPQMLHFVFERLPAGFSPMGRAVIAASAVAGVAIVGAVVSLPLMAGALVVMILSQCSLKEKILAALSLIILAAAGVGLGLGYRMVEIQKQGYLSLLDEANHSPENYRLKTLLLAEQSSRPDDLKPLFALALLKGRSTDQSGAESYYRQILEMRPDNALVVNNIGNLYFRRGQLDSAQESYSRAIALDEKLAVAHYNLGQVFFLKLRFPEGRRELERASAMDPKQIALRSGQAAGGLVLDALIPREVLWLNVWRGWTIGEGFGRGDAWLLAGPGGWLPTVGAIALAALFLAVLVITRHTKPEQYCQTCGRTICGKCDKNNEGFCPLCSEKIYSAQSPELRDKVIRSLSPQIKRRWLIKTILANAVLPGSAWALTGRPLLAWLWALLWAVVFATWRTWLFDLYPARALRLCGLGSWLLITAAVLLYLLPWLGLASYRERKP